MVGQAAGLFAVTNIDDELIPSLFFAQGAGHPGSARRIVIGQYLGFTAILAVTVAAASGATFLPESAIPYVGPPPLAFGLEAAWQAFKPPPRRGRRAAGDRHPPAPLPHHRARGGGQLMDPQHCAVDGWVDAMPACVPRGTVTFYLVVRPADIDTVDDDAPDTVITCTTEAPRITHDLLNGNQPRDCSARPAPCSSRRRPTRSPGSPSTPWRSWTPRTSRSCGRCRWAGRGLRGCSGIRWQAAATGTGPGRPWSGSRRSAARSPPGRRPGAWRARRHVVTGNLPATTPMADLVRWAKTGGVV
ncbi:hypothetical protein [Streptomyces sp. E-15]